MYTFILVYLTIFLKNAVISGEININLYNGNINLKNKVGCRPL